MSNIYQIITQLQSTSSRLEKERILQEQVNNIDLKNFFYNALEPRLNFFVKAIPGYVRGDSTISLPDAMRALGALSSRQVTGNAAISYLSNILGSLVTEDALMLERIINKDPKCNVSTTITNKVWPGLVTDVPYMRCSLPKDSNIDQFNWEYGVISQQKYDGMFISVDVIGNGQFSIMSRNGSPFPVDQFKGITDQLTQTGMEGMQLHGEVVVFKKGQMLVRKISNGIMNRVLHGDSFPADHTPVFHVWDSIPIKEAVAKNKYRVPYKIRLGILEKVLGHFDPDAPVRVTESRIVHSYDEAMVHFKELRARKLEGTIIKDRDGIWEDTTSKNCVKLKAEVEIDLKIVGFNPGSKTSKHAHLFGSIQLETSDGLLSVAATGMSDDMRADVHGRKDSLIGTIVTIRTNELFEPSKNNDKYSVFFASHH
jgi:DNA ligase-1